MFIKRVKEDCTDLLGLEFAPEMEKYKGKVITFDEIDYRGLYKFRTTERGEGDNYCYFHPNWLESVEELPQHIESEITLREKVSGDVVNAPKHYQFSEFEPVKVIQAWQLSFCLGNVIKYIARAGRKDSSKLIEDLEKAKRYIELEIEYLRDKV